MKRHEQLVKLSREHHQSLRLAKKCMDIAAVQDGDRCKAQCEEIVAIFDQEWDRHFRNEEAAIFSITARMNGRIHELGRQLAAEHDRMRELAKLMAGGQTSCDLLKEFGILLRDHTRLEERELFPMLEQQFTTEQMEQIGTMT
ncbi:hemerythrin domain-containing protein [Thiolapillus sp.]